VADALEPEGGGRRRAPAAVYFVLLAALVLLSLGRLAALRQEPSETPSPATTLPRPLSTEQLEEARAAIREVVAAARHPALRRPDFQRHRSEMEGLYGRLDFAPVWLAGGAPGRQAREAIDVLKESETRGLSSEDYDVAWLEAAWAESQAQGLAARDLGLFDAGLSVAYMRQLSDVHVGRVNPRRVRIDVDVEVKKWVLHEAVRQALDRDRVRAVVDEAEPPFEQYRRLKAALPPLRSLAADASLGPVPPVRKLTPGDAYAGVPALSRLLAALGDLPPEHASAVSTGAEPEPRYEGALVEAVKRFQGRHGLTPDGVVGAATFARLNLTMADRVRLVELALERLRWLPPPPEGPVIIVNIAGFRLWAVELPLAGAPPALTMNVVVGRALRTQTPVIREEMKHVVFRPYWNIPASILRNETLPALRRDPHYLAEQEMEIVAGDRDDSPVVEATPENLAKAGRGGYRIRQRPGSKNALGRVKFVFPNNANVYMHDTPSRGVFARDRRDLSHGCVRVAEPVALAEWVLRGVPGWDRERIERAMAADRPQQVNLPRAIPVLLFYATAVADARGQVAFFEDIYGHDRRLDEMLRAEDRDRS